MFKTASNYGFDSLVIDKTSRHIIDDFVKFVRPLSSPKYNYLLINRNGLQHNKLTHMMSQLVFEAIRKYINPTRYRQIIETENVPNLSPDEQKWVTEDQKHKNKNLLQGLKRHGHGNWVAILRDPLLDFHASRTPNALTKRITSKTFQKLL